MNRRRFCGVALLAAASCAAPSWAEDVALVENGVAKCRVVVAPEASKPEKFGAEELAKYLDKVTGCGELNGEYPIYVKVKGHPALKEDGFAIEVTPERMTIVGQNPRGALYGCYEVLKKYAGMRWLVPGDDGEYFTPKKTVAVPIGRTVSNPHLAIRETRGDDDMAGHYWHARNNMLSREGTRSFFDKNGRLSERGETLEKLTVRGCAISGHLMSLLLIGSNNKEAGEKLFAEHPEYFPEIGGRRVLSYTTSSPNPCVSNPEVLDRMAAELVRRLGVPHGNDAYCEIGNNDTTIWCECAKCKALDAPELAGTRGQRSDRYWYMMNELAKRVFRSLPDAKLCGGPYQDFWFAPARVKPDPRLYVFVSFNNQCWRHSVCDPKCSVNKVMCDIFNGWRKWNMPLVFNRDEIGAYDGQGAPGCEFQPVESVLAKNFAEYPEIACNGSHLCVHGPVPAFRNFAKKWAPFYGKSYHWYAMWQGAYVAALTMWNPKADWRGELEIANRYFYGAAWEGGMRDFRRLLDKCFFEAPGCIGWGQGAPMGRCLDVAGSEDRLKALLEKSLAAAKASGDARAERNVAREKEIFELTWLVQRKKYLDNFQELNVYRRTAPIVVDGVIDEADWKNADAISDFRATRSEPAAVKTYARVTYDEDNLYVAVECMEPTPGKIVGRIPGADETDVHVLGDRVELFYNFPDMADAAFHLCINSKGGIIAARQNSTSDRRDFKSSARFATKVYSDRWALEIAIPCSEIGSKCFDGATWKLNVARERFVEGMARTDSSSCCKGAFHGPANFMNIKFTPRRVKGIGQSHDVASWKNSSLDKHQKRDKRWPYPKFRCEEFIQPVGWNPMDVVGSYQKHPGSDSNWYVTLEYGPNANLRQYYCSRDAVHLKAFFRARGKGRLNLWTGGFETTPDGKDYNFKKGQQKLFSFDLAPEWKTYTAEVDKAATPIDRVMFKFYVDKGSVADIDDCIVTPQGAK